MVGSTARPSITREVSLTQNNGHYVRHASRHRLRVGSILGDMRRSGQTDVLGGCEPRTRPSSQALLRARRLANPRSIAVARHAPEPSRVRARHLGYGQELERWPG